MENQTVTRRRIIQELGRSAHGRYEDYLPTVSLAAHSDGAFIAHLIAWQSIKSSIRDVKIAVPVIHLHSMASTQSPGDLFENALAHLALLSPRDLLSATQFARQPWTNPGFKRQLKRMVARYVRAREAQPKWFDSVALQHKQSLVQLYRVNNLRPMTDYVNTILFGRKLDKTKAKPPQGSVFDIVRRLKDMDPIEAAGNILIHKIPFLVAVSASGAHSKSETFVLALIEGMSPQELMNNSKMLEKLGVNEKPSLRSAYRTALERTASSKPKDLAVFKVGKAVQAVSNAEQRRQIAQTQEKALDQIHLNGDWLILADKSSSMQGSIELAKQFAGALARVVHGRLFLCFFNVEPEMYEVTGMSLEQIYGSFRHVEATGGTIISCGLRAAMDRSYIPEGIIIISDGGENRGRPTFASEYKRLVSKTGDEPPVYWLRVDGDPAHILDNCAAEGVELIEHDLRRMSPDQYSIPNIISQMRVKKWSIIDEIMATPLRTLDGVFQ